jgi:phenylacetate-CoA ligase
MVTPSYSLVIAEEFERLGIKPDEISLKVGIFGAEPWGQGMRHEIERKLNLKAMDIYGLSEVMGPGVSIECVEAQNGLHVFEDHFIPEIINPLTGEVLPPGTPGELVFTTITKEAFPVIRYRTRDLSVLHPEPCRCGRTIVRMGRIQGRSDDMLIIRGVNVFPSQIESVIMEARRFEPHYQLVVDRIGNLDQLTVLVEVNESMFSDAIKNLQTVERELEKNIRETLGVTTAVKLVEPKSIQRSEGKAVRVIDKRKL